MRVLPIAFLLFVPVFICQAQQADFAGPIGEDVWKSYYTPEQRRGLRFFPRGEFSPDGKYLAMVVGDLTAGGPQQVWRYTVETKQALPVSPKPSAELDTMIQSVHWIGDTLYTTAIEVAKQGRTIVRDGLAVTGPFAETVYLKTESEQTIQIASPPTEVAVADQENPPSKRVGPYTITYSGTDVPHSHELGLWRAATKTSKKTFIATTSGGSFVSITSPPTMIYLNYAKSDKAVELLNLKDLSLRAIPLPYTYEPWLLAATRTPEGIRIAYSVLGDCSGTLFPDTSSDASRSYRHYISHICFLDTAVTPPPPR